MKTFLKSTIIIIIFIVFMSCTSTPTSFHRSPIINMQFIEELELNRNFTTKIKIEDNVIKNSDNILQQKLTLEINEKLERRGYKNNDYDAYEFNINCNIKESDKITSEFSNYSYNYTFFNTSSNYNLGVINAFNLISSVAATSYQGNYTSLTLDTIKTYEYKVIINIFDGNKKISQFSAIWITENYSPEKELSFVIKVLLSQLPNNNEYIPKVKEVKASHEKNYFNIKLKFKNIYCPALPSPVRFSDGYYDYSTAATIEPVSAYEAFVDLVKTAEKSLPIGVDAIENPLDINIWSKVRLGGRYIIGENDKIQNIIIDLNGSDDGYYVKSARVVDENEYNEYLNEQEAWNQKLQEYYNLYK